MPTPGEDPTIDAQNQAPVLMGTSIAFIVAAIAVAWLRLYTRTAIRKALGPDDALIIISLFLSIGVTISTILQTRYGLGRHKWMVSDGDMMNQLKSLFAGMIFYNTSQICIKLSFLMLYRRIFSGDGIRKVCFWLTLLLGAWGITQDVLVGMSCNPVAIFEPSWQAVCVDGLTIWYLTSITNIVTDFVIFLLPMQSIRKLQLRRKQKILVASLFGLGFFTCIISIVRLFSLYSAINTTDPTWDNVPASYWTVVELNCGIICACLSTLRPLVSKLIPSAFHRSGAASGQSSDFAAKEPAARGYNPRDVQGGNSQYDFGFVLRPSSSRDPVLATAIYGGKSVRDVGLDELSLNSVADDGAGDQQIKVTRETTVEESRVGSH